MKKKFISLLISGILLLGIFLLPLKTYAIDGSVSVSTDKSTYNVGDPITVTITVNFSEACSLQGAVSPSGGVSLGGNLVLYNESSAAGSWSATYSGTITGEGDQVISASVNIASKVEVNPDTLEVANVDRSGAAGFHVITQAEIQASKEASEAAEESRRAEEARQASIAASIAEEESRAQASRDEETREEAERQASIDASIAEEQRKIAESRAIEESKRNASIAESVSVEESKRQESLSIEESIEEESRSIAESEEEESRSIAAESESIAESISESESIENLTRAFEVGEDYFVPWEFSSDSGRFLFAVEDTNIEAPEEYEKTDLIVNKQYIWAAQSEKTAARTYLVFGTYDESIAPAFYYFDLDTGRLFPYDNLNSKTDNRPARIETEAESSSTEEETVSEDNVFPVGRAILFAVSGAVIGAALFGLVLVLLKLARSKKEEEPVTVPDQPEDPVGPPSEDIDEAEELPLEESDVSDPDETMKILFGGAAAQAAGDMEEDELNLPDGPDEDDIELAIVEEESVIKDFDEPDLFAAEDESELALVEEDAELPLEEEEAATKLPEPEEAPLIEEVPDHEPLEAVSAFDIAETETADIEPAAEAVPEPAVSGDVLDDIPVIPVIPVEKMSLFDEKPADTAPVPDEELIIPESSEEGLISDNLSEGEDLPEDGEDILGDDDVAIIAEDEVELDSVFDRK